MMIHNLMARPFIALCLLLVCVYISESYIGYLILFSILLSTCLFLFYKYKQSTNLNWLWFIPVIIALCYIRLAFHHQAHHYDPTSEPLNLQDKWAIVKESTLSIQSADLIVSIPDKHEYILAKIKIDSLCHESKIYAGDSILLNGILHLIKLKAQFDGFDYNEYLLRNHIQFTGRFNSNTIQIVPKKNFDIFNAANKANVYISNILFQSISDSQLANLLIAILVGNKSEVSTEIKNLFIATGTAHILAVSGMHLGMLYGILKFLFLNHVFKSKKIQKIQSPIILCLIWFFAFLTGFGSSVIRAAVMFTFLECGLQLNRISNAVNILFASAFFMLFYNPCILYDIGFQLSFAAVLSIVLFQHMIKRIFITSNKWINKMLEIIQVTLAVQILVTPISTYYFHSFPIYFLFSNLIWIPLSFLLMVLGIGILITHFIWVPISVGLGMISSYLLTFGLWIFSVLEKLPYFQLNQLVIYPEQLIFIYLTLFLLYWWLHLHQTKYLYLALCCILLSGIGHMIRVIYNSHTNELICYHKKTNALIDVRIGQTIYSFTENPSSTVQKLNDYLQYHQVNEYIQIPIDSNSIHEIRLPQTISTYQSIRILINRILPKADHTFQVIYIKKGAHSFEDFLQAQNCNIAILSYNLSKKARAFWISELTCYQIPYLDLSLGFQTLKL